LKTNRIILAAGTILAAAVFSMAAQEKMAPPTHTMVAAKELKWTPIIKGCEMSVVEGNPDAAGEPFVIRIHCVDGTKVPAHWHPTDEKLTVLKGTFLLGTGDTFDAKKLHAMKVGDFAAMPKEVRHFAQSKGDNIVQVHGLAPFKVNWVNPADVIPPDAKPAK
jgi:quercetin dioxygenase-like cupin family protein